MNLGAKLLLNWIAVAIGVLLGIALYRIQLHTLGAKTLGTWVALSSLCGYLSLLELGLGAAMNKYVAAHNAKGDYTSEETLLSTALFLYMVLALLVLFLGAGLSLVAGQLLRLSVLPPFLQTAAHKAILLLSINVAASFVLCVFRGVVFGSGRSDIIAITTIGRHLVYAALVVTLLRNGRGLVGLACAGLIADVLAGLVLYRSAVRLRKGRPPIRLSPPDWPLTRELLGYCAGVVLITIGLSLLRSSTVPILQRCLGPEVVASYAPAERLATLFFTLVSQMGVVMVPPVAAACTLQPGSSATIVGQAGRLGMALGLPPLVVLLVMGDKLLRVWLGPAFAESALYLRILGLALFAQLVSFGVDLGAYALGGRRAYGLTKLGSGLVSLVVSWVFVRLFGVTGAALSCTLVITLCDAILTPIVLCRVLGYSVLSYYRMIGRRLVLALLCLGLLSALMRVYPHLSLVSLLLGCAAGASLGFLVTYATYLEDADRLLLRGRFSSSSWRNS